MLTVEIHKVIEFAMSAHDGQLRKYTNTPYITHPLSVAFIVASVTSDPDVIAAAILHDTIEDTNTTPDDILKTFGQRIMNFVVDVTDISKPEDGNRKTRKKIDRLHLAKAAPESKTIKLADIIDNISSIVEYDKPFSKIYIREKELLLPYLIEGDRELYENVKTIIKSFKTN
jgi:(p)ppGpp synthase/HD superfamily hydrolase